jgi:hypothetical protein
MGSWQVQDAKARFSEFLDATIEKGRSTRKPTRVSSVRQQDPTYLGCLAAV